MPGRGVGRKAGSPRQFAVVLLERSRRAVGADRRPCDDDSRADMGRSAGVAAWLTASEPGCGDAGFDRVEFHVGNGLCILDVSIEAAALLEPYTMAGKREAGRVGSWVAQNEPRALETFTTTGLAELRNSGSAGSRLPASRSTSSDVGLVASVVNVAEARAASLGRPLDPRPLLAWDESRARCPAFHDSAFAGHRANRRPQRQIADDADRVLDRQPSRPRSIKIARLDFTGIRDGPLADDEAAVGTCLTGGDDRVYTARVLVEGSPLAGRHLDVTARHS